MAESIPPPPNTGLPLVRPVVPRLSASPACVLPPLLVYNPSVLEPLNPKLKDSLSFEAACGDVSETKQFCVLSYFRHWHHHARLQDGPTQRVGFVDREASVLLPARHRQG
jgi:hypothetical protein